MKEQITKYNLTCRILQNGRIVKTFETPFDENGHFFITSNVDDPLGITLYPLSRPISVFTTSKNGTYIEIDHPWEGFIQSGGEVLEVKGYHQLGKSFRFSPGDIASLGWNDLRFLAKVEPRGKSRRKWPVPKFLPGDLRGSFISDWFGDAPIRKASVYAVVASLVSAAIFYSAVIFTQKERPREFEQLPLSYLGSFISPDHLVHAPETLQDLLNPDDLIGSIVKFYRNLTWLLLGTTSGEIPAISETFERLVESEKIEVEEEFERYLAIKKGENTRILSVPGRSLLAVPAVKRISKRETILSLIERIYLMHESYGYTAKQKVDLISKFEKETGYKWDEYERKAKSSATRGSALFSSMQGGFQRDRENLTAYELASVLGDEIRIMQNYYLSQLDEGTELSIDTLDQVYMKFSDHHMDFTIPLEKISLGEKENKLVASTFGSSPIKRTVEPLIGSINEEKVQTVISRGKFQVQLCYESALRRNQSLKGNMAWQWRIDTRGEISDIELMNSELSDNSLVRCVRRKIAAWKFPPAKVGSVKIFHQFKFKPIKG